jgi:hypothetical protein
MDQLLLLDCRYIRDGFLQVPEKVRLGRGVESRRGQRPSGARREIVGWRRGECSRCRLMVMDLTHSYGIASIRFAGFTFSACASSTMLSKPMLRSPRSTPPM